ncbi:MAG: ATP-binding protein [Armatimonadota bacterium]|nr:ATP-binding protein [Armatimonadota bacterium]MDR7532831.1 ATP-binding protein [Armatimonadota bacterium]MDR7535165.1 ATP-binding protein [Armatimonadota bacterium]
MRPRSIRSRLALSYLALATLCLVLVATFVTWRLQLQYTTTYAWVIERQARLIGRMLEEYARDGGADPARLERLAQEFRWRPDATIRVLPAAALRTPARTGPAGELAALAACLDAPQRTGDCTFRTVRRDPAEGGQRVFAASPVLVDGRLFAVVHVSVPTGWVWVQLRRMLPQLGVGLVIGMVLAWVLGARLARGLVEPIEDLTRVATRMSAGDLTQTVAPRGADEIARLAEHFNHMAGRLREMVTTLEAERTRLETILASMSDGVVAVDRGGTLILANRAASDLLAPGRRGDEAFLRPGPRLRALLAETAARGQPCTGELPPAEVGTRLVEVHCAPLPGEGGGPGGAVAVLRDVTELRRLERVRRELTANVSHELRTPLTSIKGFAETLLGGAMHDEATGRRFLEIIDKEANRLVKLVDDLLDLSRLEDKRVTLQLGQVDVGTLVDETLARLRPLAGARVFDVQAPPGEVVALADRDRLSQVLTNLLDNAIKFTPDGGRIAIGWRCTDGEVEISISDAGPGIAPDDLPHVFERFYKADRARPASPGGSGLGLAITKHIVEAHGGRIAVTSAPGAGTTFVVTLPRNGD